MALRDKTDQELMCLLNEFGIKHGPIVDSTRRLYEKKLEKAMAEYTKPSDNPNPSSDKTYYREEEEEVTYVHYHTPVKSEGCGDHLSRRNVANNKVDDGNDDDDTQPPVQSTEAAYHSAACSKQPIQEPARGISPAGGMSLWKWLFLFAVVAGLLYVIYCSLEADAPGDRLL